MMDLSTIIDQCVSPSHRTVMMAIVKVESGGKPLVIGLNKGYRLQTQPQNESQAKAWVDYLEKNNYNFDVGIGQVNIKNIHRYGYKASDFLDPCLNLKVASDIFDKSHQYALARDNSQNALQKAISAYNTGNFSSGFANGYVAKVNSKLLAANNSSSDIPPIINIKQSTKPVTSTKKATISQSNGEQAVNPYSAKSVLYVAPPKKVTKEEYDNAVIQK
jgi:type IV secretion system protein VirB1